MQIVNTGSYLCHGTQFDFPSRSFDRIVLITVLGEVAGQAAYLQEFHRLLRPDGIVSISETAGDPDKLSRAQLATLMQAHRFVLQQSYGTERNYTMNFQAA